MEVMRHLLPAFLLSTLLFAQQDPWAKSELLQPEQLAARLKSGAKPLLIEVSFAMLYRQRHLPEAVYAGPAARQQGIDLLKTALANVPKGREIVIYCGCCPMDHCPNLRPAYQVLRELGFKNFKVLSLPTNLAKDWIDKGYPIVRIAAQ